MDLSPPTNFSSTACNLSDISACPDGHDLTGHIAFGTSLIISIIAISVIANLGVVIVVLKTSFLRTQVTYIYVLNLCFVDLLASIFVLPLSAASYVQQRWPFGRSLCLAEGFLSSVCMFGSILAICLISIERFYIIKWPMHYAVHMTYKKATALLCGFWVLAVANAAFPLFGWSSIAYNKSRYHCTFTSVHPSYTISVFVMCFCLPGLVTLLMYYGIYRIAKHTVSQIYPDLHSTLPVNQTVDDLPPNRNASACRGGGEEEKSAECGEGCNNVEISYQSDRHGGQNNSAIQHAYSIDVSEGSCSSKTGGVGANGVVDMRGVENGMIDIRNVGNGVIDTRGVENGLIDIRDVSNEMIDAGGGENGMIDVRIDSPVVLNRVQGERGSESLNNQPSDHSTGSGQRVVSHWKAIRTLFIIITFFMALWAPYFALLLHGIQQTTSTTPIATKSSSNTRAAQGSADMITVWLGFASYAANPLVYGLLNRTVREAISLTYVQIRALFIRIDDDLQDAEEVDNEDFFQFLERTSTSRNMSIPSNKIQTLSVGNLPVLEELETYNSSHVSTGCCSQQSKQ